MAGLNGVRRAARRSRPGGTALVASVLLHGVAAGVVWSTGLAARPSLPPFKVYEVNIVSPRPKVAGPSEPIPVPVEPPKVAKPEPEPTPPKPETKPKPEPKPQPKPEPAKPKAEAPKPATPAVVEEKPEEKPAESPPKGPRPDPKAEAGGEDLEVKIDGESFPFPDYLNNIIRQISRYFRWAGSSDREAWIYFVIQKDGSVREIRVVQPSGDIQFDLQAMGAVELAGKNRAFGPLPEGFGRDALPIEFYFRPAR